MKDEKSHILALDYENNRFKKEKPDSPGITVYKSYKNDHHM